MAEQTISKSCKLGDYNCLFYLLFFYCIFLSFFFLFFVFFCFILLLTNFISYQQNIYDYRHSSDSNINSRIRFYHPVFFLLAAYIDQCTQECVFWGNCISGSAICAHRNFCVPPSPRYRNRKKPTELGSLAYYESDIDKRQPRHSRRAEKAKQNITRKKKVKQNIKKNRNQKIHSESERKFTASFFFLHSLITYPRIHPHHDITAELKASCKKRFEPVCEGSSSQKQLFFHCRIGLQSIASSQKTTKTSCFGHSKLVCSRCGFFNFVRNPISFQISKKSTCLELFGAK